MSDGCKFKFDNKCKGEVSPRILSELFPDMRSSICDRHFRMHETLMILVDSGIDYELFDEILNAGMEEVYKQAAGVILKNPSKFSERKEIKNIKQELLNLLDYDSLSEDVRCKILEQVKELGELEDEAKQLLEVINHRNTT